MGSTLAAWYWQDRQWWIVRAAGRVKIGLRIGAWLTETMAATRDHEAVFAKYGFVNASPKEPAPRSLP